MINLTEDERIILSIFDEGTRAETLREISRSLNYMDSTEMAAIMKSCAMKIVRMDENEFRSVPRETDFSLVFADTGDEEDQV